MDKQDRHIRIRLLVGTLWEHIKAMECPYIIKKIEGRVTHFTAPTPKLFFGALHYVCTPGPQFLGGGTLHYFCTPPIFLGGEAHFMASAPGRHEPYSHATDVRYPQALHSTSAFPAANKPAFFSAALFRRPLAVQHTEYIYVSSRISGYSNGSEGRIAADAVHMSCIGVRLQGGP